MYCWDNLAFIFHLNISYFLFFSWLLYPCWAHGEGAGPIPAAYDDIPEWLPGPNVSI